MQYKFKDTPHKAQNAFDEGLYSFRKSPNVLDGAYDRLLLNKVVGGTLAVNQLANIHVIDVSKTENGVTITDNRDGTYTVYTDAGGATGNLYIALPAVQVTAGHRYYFRSLTTAGNPNTYYAYVTTNVVQPYDYGTPTIGYASTSDNAYIVPIYVKTGTVITTPIKVKPQYIDLTQTFGTTIADYVYNLEQSTAGSGVAWLKQYYPSIFNSYQPYNAGTLESVEASAHRMTGFNQWDEEIEVGRINTSTGENQTSTDRLRCKNYISVIPNTNYYLSCQSLIGGSTASIYVYLYDENQSFIGLVNGSNTTISIPQNGRYMRFMLGGAYGMTFKNDICVNISSSRNGDYEPYTQTSYPLDSDLVLRGVPKLNNGVPYYDGDEYKSDGTVTRKYGVVDLGTLTWTGSSGLKITTGLNSVIKRPSAGNVVANITTTNYTVSAAAPISANDGKIGVDTSGRLQCGTSDTPTGYLVYELATPTTETADPFTNPQVVYADGTEEFTDFAVASGRRDISLPVQCESMYYEAVPLPAEALSINGKFIEDVIDGYRTLNVSGRETMAQEVKEAEVGKHDGAFFQYRRYPTRDIVVKYQIIAESNEAYRNAFIKLNQMLDFSEGVLIFNDETDKYFVGTPTDVELPEPGLNCAVGEFTLHCEDPFKYSVQEKGVAMQSDANGYFFGLDYKGTHKSYPRIETDFYKTDTEDDSNGECSFISFMKTDGKILLFGDPENTGANRAPVRIFQRASSAPAVPSSQVTFSFESQTVTNPSALGSWSTTIPSGESALWTTMAIAESTATNAYINQADWGTVEQYANQDDSALYSINSKTEVNKKFTSQGTAWASNSGKTYNGWPETGTPGIVTLSGNKYITASGYGSGSNWHGPSVTRTKSDDIRDFLFTFNYAFYQGTGDQASKQTGLLQAVLWNSTQSKIIAALSFWKNSGNSKGSIRMVVGGKSVKTLSEVPFGILTQNACSIKKIGSTVIFNVKGTEYRFVDESIKETATDKITLYFAKKGTTTAMKEIGVHSAQLIKYYQPVSPNPFTSNDELRINTKNTAVQLNGLDAQGLGALANDWEGFYLKPGINLIGVVWSEYVSSAYKPTCRLYYREVYL